MEGVVRPCEVADRDQELVDLGVASRDPMQDRYEVERVPEIGRAFAAGLGEARSGVADMDQAPAIHG